MRVSLDVLPRRHIMFKFTRGRQRTESHSSYNALNALAFRFIHTVCGHQVSHPFKVQNYSFAYFNPMFLDKRLEYLNISYIFKILFLQFQFLLFYFRNVKRADVVNTSVVYSTKQFNTGALLWTYNSPFSWFCGTNFTVLRGSSAGRLFMGRVGKITGNFSASREPLRNIMYKLIKFHFSI